MRSCVIALSLAACWRGDPAAPARAPTAPKRAVRIPPPAASPLDLDDPEILARTLRTKPHLVLADEGPIIFVDFDTGAVETLCGRDARDHQDAWSAMLADPMRGAPSCGRGSTVTTCMQISDRPLLILQFTLDAPLRPTMAMMGTLPTPGAGLTTPALKQAKQSARCP